MNFFRKIISYGSVPLLIALVTVVGWRLFSYADYTLRKKPNARSFDMACLRDSNNLVPMVIIGSGPAGLNAALYAGRAQLDPLVIEGDNPGGALMETTYVENWPARSKILGKDIISEAREQAKGAGAKFLRDTVTSVDFSQWPYAIYTQKGITLRALSIVIATGSTPKTLGIPGEKDYWGKGVTTCALCDAPFHKGHTVVVIGGGDSAIEEATQLAAYADKVYILVRKDSMRAARSMQDRLKGYPTISVLFNKEVTAIRGDDKEVTHIDVYDNVTKQSETMQAQGVFLAIGHTPNSALFAHDLVIDEQGYIAVDKITQQTSVPGVFAAGDVQDNVFKQAVVASGDGAKASISAASFLMHQGYSAAFEESLHANMFKFGQEADARKHVVALRSEQDFVEKVKQSQGTVVVDFYADYCPSCLKMLPDVEEIANTFAESVTFYKVDVEEVSSVAEDLHIKSIPALLVFQNGALVGRFNEAMSRQQLNECVLRFVPGASA